MLFFTWGSKTAKPATQWWFYTNLLPGRASNSTSEHTKCDILLTGMSAIRTMVLQNRLVLDLLTASSGGVCKMVGDTCCTFIPDVRCSGLPLASLCTSWSWQLLRFGSWKGLFTYCK
uniref:Uncharacterized protein n=1 Tax=Oryzias latipes TaxID=8090 RepID=A0A3P9JE44_ORYLA